MMKKRFNVKGMTCAACQSHVYKSVCNLQGVKDVNVNLIQNVMDIEFDENKCSEEIICNAVKNAGYEAYIPSNEDKKISHTKDKSLILLIISFIFLALLMYVSMGHMIHLPLPSFLEDLNNSFYYALLQLILTIPVIIIYHRYFISGYKKLLHLKPNMDSLIAISATASIIYGITMMIFILIAINNNDLELVNKYRHNLYFESASMILVMVSLGKYLENKSKKKTTTALENLINLAPKKALIYRDDKEVLVLVDEVKENDVVIVKKGDIIPVDGRIIQGYATIDQSNITGESYPISKGVNDEVFASTIVTSGYLKVEALKVNKDTSIAQIIKLVEEASNSKAPISKLADKISGYFVPVIISIAILSFSLFMIFGYEFKEAFNFGISVLVIACPCALGLATPVAIMVGTGKAAENGLLIKNAEILEKTQYIKTIVLDKTGTLTKGKMSVSEIISYDDNLLSYAYSLEKLSEHPLATAIIKKGLELNVFEYKVSNYESLDGIGLKGTINNKNIMIGNKRVLEYKDIKDDKVIELVDKYSNEGRIPLIVIDDDKVLGIIVINDELKETSIEAIKELKNMGLNIIMLTGDNKNTANYIASKLGIDEVYSEVLPLEKEDIIKKIKRDKYHLVAMVGDGVNDALALTSSDLAIAVGGGSELALQTSDIILLRKDLLDIKNIISLSKRIFNTIKGNLFWAFFYNSIGIILASGVLYPAFKISLNPMIGAIAMSLSSVFVVLNALTINFFKINKREVNINKEENNMKTVKLNVEGMMCPRCKAHVEKALLSIEGVKEAIADLETNSAMINCEEKVTIQDLIDVINNEGYKAFE